MIRTMESMCSESVSKDNNDISGHKQKVCTKVHPIMTMTTAAATFVIIGIMLMVFVLMSMVVVMCYYPGLMMIMIVSHYQLDSQSAQ